MISIDELKFDEKGLIPAVVQDFENGRGAGLTETFESEKPPDGLCEGGV